MGNKEKNINKYEKYNYWISIINIIIAGLALYIAYSIPYNIFQNEQEFNLQGLDNLLTYSVISNIKTETGTTNGYIEIQKKDLLNVLDNSLDKMTNISKKVFNEDCSNKSNSGVLNELGNINGNYYDSIFTYFSNLKRNTIQNNKEIIIFPICNGNLVNNNIGYYNYYNCLSRIIGNCLK